MKTRISLLFLVVVCTVAIASFPRQGAKAQATPSPTPKELQAEVNALTAQVNSLQSTLAALQSSVGTLQTSVNKLDGNIIADDLVGTYSIQAFQTELGPSTSSSQPAEIAASVYTGTGTFNADGTGTLTQTQSGWVLTQGTWQVSQPSWVTGTGSTSITWTYSDGVVTLSSGGVTLAAGNVSVGGRVLTFAATGADHTTSFYILTRLI